MAYTTYTIINNQLLISNSRPLLKEIKKAGITHIFIDVRIERLAQVLKQAQQVGLMTSYHHYFISSLVSFFDLSIYYLFLGKQALSLMRNHSYLTGSAYSWPGRLYVRRYQHNFSSIDRSHAPWYAETNHVVVITGTRCEYKIWERGIQRGFSRGGFIAVHSSNTSGFSHQHVAQWK